MFFIIMRKKTLDKLIASEVDKVAHNCYKLGYQMGKTETTNLGFIIGDSMLDREIEEILRKARN